MNIHIRPQACPCCSSLTTNEVLQEQCTTSAIWKKICPTPNYINIVSCDIKNLYWLLLIWEIIYEFFGMDPAPWRSPWKSVYFCHCPISSSATQEQASRALQGPVLALLPPCAGHPQAVIAQRHGWCDTQRQLWCEIEDFSRGLIPTPVPHRPDAQGRAVFRGCWVSRCVMPWNCGMGWKLMERGFLTMFCWLKNGISMVEILAEHSFSRYWAKVSGLMGLLKGRVCLTSGAWKSCSCISPFCDAAQHAW